MNDALFNAPIENTDDAADVFVDHSSTEPRFALFIAGVNQFLPNEFETTLLEVRNEGAVSIQFCEEFHDHNPVVGVVRLLQGCLCVVKECGGKFLDGDVLLSLRRAKATTKTRELTTFSENPCCFPCNRRQCIVCGQRR